MAGKPRKRESMKGRRFGRLLVLDEGGRGYGGTNHWRYHCRCDCGKDSYPRSVDLLSGRAKSCGCLLPSRWHGKSGIPEYWAWMHMKNRCLNPNDADYHRHGGRGIGIFQEWVDSFAAFFRDMGFKPSKEHVLTRIDPDGHYEPGNCQWKVPEKKAAPVPKGPVYFYMGETKTLEEWAEIFGMNPAVIQERLDRGLPFALAILRFSNVAPKLNHQTD